ncbi:UTP--glucose-1-phosphate uridylyltransferase [Eubacterium xylanophilum]|uniref:UTP--glucose-1-phosphate uridylyltransferase n=1 Tax=Eubacterium xylanophilum TaxID=39497 RepID=UPI00047CC9A6|nr:UDPGP type 1 family protein [Eubacterium xylanophilum]
MDILAITNKLKENNQEQLLKYYDEISDEEKEYLCGQIEKLDFSILDNIKNGAGSDERGVIEPIGALTIEEINEDKKKYEEVGLKAIKAGEVGAVLLAGGQGTRLGLDCPKGMLNVGVNKTLYLFEQLINNIMDVVNKAGTYVPLYIMTSEKNNEDTVNFFEENNYFGYDKSFVKFFVQEMAPSTDYNGKIYLEEKGKVSMSPNGNGGWFLSMEHAGLVDEMSERGVKWLNVFSVDNVLQKIADPVFVGASIEKNVVCGSKVVAKAAPDEKVGVLCLEDGKPSIVEYYEMTDDMINLRHEDGKLQYNYGVILNYLFDVATLKRLVKSSLPIHIVEKKIPHIDENGDYIKPDSPNGYKFETLVLDMIHMMDNCLAFEVERSREFAPIKNATGVDSLESARELMRLNGIEF